MKKTIGFLLGALIFFACNNEQSATADNSTATDSVSNNEMSTARGYEFADDKYVQMAKEVMQNLSSGNMDGYFSVYADNAVYRFSGGDSLSGKQAITDYWKKGRSEVIDSLSYASEAWLPVKINTPMYTGQLQGNYALTWNMVTAKYKTGKTMTQRMHMVFHFDDNDKIDRVTQYLDRVPVNAATAK